MKRNILTFICLLALTVSCTPTTPQQQVVLVTATPWIVTATPAPTETLTEAPTATPSPTPNHTPTPRIIPTPTQTPKPSFVWRTDFERGLTGFTGGFGNTTREGAPGNTSNANYGIVSDPTNSNRGMVYRATVLGPSAFQNGIHRPYPDLYFPFKKGSYSTELKVFLGSGFQPNNLQGDYWLSLISLFDIGSPVFHPSVMVNLAGMRSALRLETLSFYPNKVGLKNDRVSNAPNFRTNQWVEIRVDVDVFNQSVRTYQDGVLVSQGEYVATELGIAGAHWGLYGKGLTNFTLLNDDIALYVYSTTTH